MNSEKVLDIVKNIPTGKVMTYGQIAQKAGNKNYARSVGTLMAKNTDKNIPCHRVVNSGHKIGKYNGLRGDKKLLLIKEGVKFTKTGLIANESIASQI